MTTQVVLITGGLTGQADLVALARGMLYDPRWGWHSAAELGAAIDDAPP
jgi:NADPH2 dehydrogenase